jgi:putative flippase GtrA
MGVYLIVKLWRENRFLRYFLVGIANTALPFSMFSALVLVGVPYLLANLSACIAGIAIAYQLQGRLVFQRLSRGSFLRYLILLAAVFVAQIAIIWATIKIVDQRLFLGFINTEILGGGLALVLTLPVNFFMSNIWVYRR